MREIKFRAWDKKRQEMICDHLEYEMRLLANHCSCDPRCKENAGFIGFPANCPRFIHMQFTGLKDENGKEIYEGDILQPDNGDAKQVWFNEDEAMFTLLDYECFPTYLGEVVVGGAEVIGNIYANPELKEG